MGRRDRLEHRWRSGGGEVEVGLLMSQPGWTAEGGTLLLPAPPPLQGRNCAKAVTGGSLGMPGSGTLGIRRLVPRQPTLSEAERPEIYWYNIVEGIQRLREIGN